MTNNSDFESYKAKEKVKSLALLLVFGVILGGVWEYQKTQTSLDSVWIVYDLKEVKFVEANKKTKDDEARVIVEPLVEDGAKEIKAEVAEEVLEPKVSDEKNEAILQDIEEKGKDEDVSLEEKNEVVETKGVDEDKSSDEQVVEEVKIEVQEQDAVYELLGYMGEIKDKLNNVEVPVLVLDKVIVKAEESKPLEENANFKDGEIEIYDSELGVVGVEKVEVVTENDESQKTEEGNTQVIENKEENIEDKPEEVIEETIDMMKNIVNRNMEEKQ